MKKFLVLSGISITIMAALVSCSKNTNGNPLLEEWSTPFGVPPFDRVKTEHYLPAIKEAIAIHNKEIQDIVNNKEVPDFENVILALDNSGELLNRIATMLSLVGSAHTTPELQKVREEVTPMLAEHYDDILMNRKLFDKIETVYYTRNSSGLRPLQIRLTEKKHDDFVRAGSKLHDADKERLKQINMELSSASFKFADNLLEENGRYLLLIDDEGELSGFPKTIKDIAADKAKSLGHDGKWAFTLSQPSMAPFLSYAQNEELRKEIYTAYSNRGNNGDSLDNNEIVKNIVKLRTERAHLLGYTSHADYVLARRMAKTPEAVYSLLDDLWEPAMEAAKTELEELRALKIQAGKGSEFFPWDWQFYSEKLRKSKYNLNEEDLRPYFSADNVRSGIFLLVNKLYGVAFRPQILPVYSDDCMVYEVLDSDGKHLGILYLDLYAREGQKRGGAWCASFRDQGYQNGERISPIVTIVCNFPRPTNNTPSLLSLDEVETFFHEFGHAMHSLFPNVPYRGLLDVEYDFVELPSQIMENWALRPEMLYKYAIHYNSNNNSANRGVIPSQLISKIQNSMLFNQGFKLTELLAASYLDMDIHTLKDGIVEDLAAFETQMLNEKRGLIREIPPRYHLTYFSHIFSGGYSAGYYGYVWSEVLDKDAFEAFLEKKDVFDKKTAEKFRKEILTRGGTADGMTLYVNFRGAEPKREPLLKARGFNVPNAEAVEEDVDVPDGQENGNEELDKLVRP